MALDERAKLGELVGVVGGRDRGLPEDQEAREGDPGRERERREQDARWRRELCTVERSRPSRPPREMRVIRGAAIARALALV